ncbi:MAG: ribonuclease P protein component [Candidatus Berkelbacteria bacterium]
MLNKSHRIQQNSEYQRIYKDSRPVYVGNLILRLKKNNLDNAGKSVTRFGFVVSNKIDKRATRRNNLKRKLRGAVDELLSEIKSGYDIVLIVKHNYAYPYDFDLIKKEIVAGLQKLQVINA